MLCPVCGHRMRRQAGGQSHVCPRCGNRVARCTTCARWPALQDLRDEALVADFGKGLVCPRCGCRHFKVVYTRPTRHGRIQRRRECRHCGWRCTTCERVVAGQAGP